MKQSEIAGLLPEIFRRTVQPRSLLEALLAVMEALHEPSEEVLATLDHYFDPYRTPERFVPFLAMWVNLSPLLRDASDVSELEAQPLSSGTGRLRELIVLAADLSHWRGTRYGLQRFLETATGIGGFEINEQVVDTATGQVRPYHILIRASPETRQFQPLLEKIIEMEKPAYVTYELEFRE
jgi:phage tail-like protein